MGSGNLTFQIGHERSLLCRRLSFIKKEGRHLSTAIGVSSIFNLNHATSLPLLVRVVLQNNSKSYSITLVAFMGLGICGSWRPLGNILPCMCLLIIEKHSEGDRRRT